MTRTRFPLAAALAAVVVCGLAAPLFAADGGPLFAGYWADFKRHWVGAFQRQNGIVMFVLGMGAIGLFIITRGKWRK